MDEAPASAGTSPRRVAPIYGPALRLALIQQAATLALTALMLDGGRTLRACAVAALAHWAAILLVLARRPDAPARSDLGLVRYGFWGMLLLVRLLAPAVRRLIGAT